MLQVVCVRWGAGYGVGYVNRLYAGVERNLTLPHRFVCFTDDPAGLADGIEARPLPPGVPGWWNKLYLFKRDLFPEGDRVLYIDLDTVFPGSLDQLAAYAGDFVMLRDFYRTTGRGSALMAWKAGYAGHVWDAWLAAGSPALPMEVEPDGETLNGGDQKWIEQQVPSSDIWQDLYPGQVVSFKVDCHPVPPDGARVVCFHGEPKMHDCGQAWVEALWNENDCATFDPKMKANVSAAVIKSHSQLSAALNLPRLTSKPRHDRTVVIVGGGPSARECVNDFRRHADAGHDIWALNGAYRWLLDAGVKVSAFVLLDARRRNAKFVERPEPGVVHYIASQCHPAVYAALQDSRVVRYDLEVMGACGTTVGTHAMCVAYTEGYRNFHLYGYDSSYRDNDAHAYDQVTDMADVPVTAHAGTRTFQAAVWMVKQVKDFQSLATDFHNHGASIVVHGDGLLPYVVQQMAA